MVTGTRIFTRCLVNSTVQHQGSEEGAHQNVVNAQTMVALPCKVTVVPPRIALGRLLEQAQTVV